jgi:hypothetical protein
MATTRAAGNPNDYATLIIDEKKAEIRRAAFLFSRQARGADDWRAVIGRRVPYMA